MEWNVIAVFVEGIESDSLIDTLPLGFEPTEEVVKLDEHVLDAHVLAGLEPDGMVATLPGWSVLWLPRDYDLTMRIGNYFEIEGISARALVMEIWKDGAAGGFCLYDAGSVRRELWFEKGRITWQQETPLPEESGIELPGGRYGFGFVFTLIKRLVGVHPLDPGIPWCRARYVPWTEPRSGDDAHDISPPQPASPYAEMLVSDQFVSDGWESIAVFIEGIVPRDLAVFLPEMYKATATTLSYEQTRAPSLAPAIAMARFEAWDAAWMPGVDLVRLDARLAVLSARRRSFVALCSEELDRFGFIWYAGGSAARAVMYEEGEITVDHGDPLPEEERGESPAWDSDGLFDLARRLTGVGAVDLRSATYRRGQLLVYKGDPLYDEDVALLESSSKGSRGPSWPGLLIFLLLVPFVRTISNGCNSGSEYSDRAIPMREMMLRSLADPTAVETTLIRDLGFDERVLDVARMEGDSIRRYYAQGDGESLLPRRALEFSVTGGAAPARLRSTRPDLRKLGYQAFISYQEPGAEHDRIGIIRGIDQFDILTITRAGSGPGAPGTAVVTEVMAEWNERYGLRIEGAGRNWVDAVLEERPESNRMFAREVFALAPDSAGKPAAAAIESIVERLIHYREIRLRWPPAAGLHDGGRAGGEPPDSLAPRRLRRSERRDHTESIRR